MKKRYFVSLIMTMLALSMMVTPAVAAMLYPPGYKQEKDGWCWAAVDKSIIHYYKKASPTQSTIVSEYDSTPSTPGATIGDANRALTGNGIRTSLWQNSKLTFAGIVWQIDNKRLIFASGYMYPILGPYHALLIRGYDSVGSKVYFIDPSDGLGHAQGYANFCDGYHWDNNPWTWEGSIFDTRL